MIRTKRRALVVFPLAVLLATTGICDELRPRDLQISGVESAQLTTQDEGWSPHASKQATPAQNDLPLPALDCRLPGEFETQRALLLACRDLIDDYPELLADIVKQTRNRLDIVLLVSDCEQCEAVEQLLQANSIPLEHVHFVELPHDTMWARDYGPLVLSSKTGHPVVIDADYEQERVNDDSVPTEFAQLLKLPVVQIPLRLDGGNLLSNGDGLAITTSPLFDENAPGEFENPELSTVLRDSCGLKQVEVLEPLAGEPTGHVDMFATFTSMNTVIVGKFDPEVDPLNAEILDRNAARLSQIRTTKGPLRVVRIVMPPHDDGVWRTYTNVIYANGVLLVPTYADADRGVRGAAFGTYMQVMPHWKVVGVDASRVIESEGALHCMTMNLGPLGRLPAFPRPTTHAADRFEIIIDFPVTLNEEEDELSARIMPREVIDHDRESWQPATPFRHSDRSLQDFVNRRVFQKQFVERQQVPQPAFFDQSP